MLDLVTMVVNVEKNNRNITQAPLKFITSAGEAQDLRILGLILMPKTNAENIENQINILKNIQQKVKAQIEEVLLMKFTGKTSFRVRYAETDKMGIVYHSNYLVWFEVGRSELFRDLNLPYKVFEEQDLGLTIIEAGCRYRQPAFTMMMKLLFPLQLISTPAR